MRAPFQPTRAPGFSQPPFLTTRGRRRRRSGWWSGVIARDKAAVFLSGCAVVAMVIVLMASAGTGNGATGVLEPDRTPARAAVSLTDESMLRSVEALRVTVLSGRLKATLDLLTSIAGEVEGKLGDLSRVVQGGRCSLYLAALPVVSDAGFPGLRAAGVVPEDPEGTWLYANELADSYLPGLERSALELRRLRSALVEVGFLGPLKGLRGILLESCDLQLSGTRRLARGLKLVRDCNEMTVGEALELSQWAVRELAEGTALLEHASGLQAVAD